MIFLVGLLLFLCVFFFGGMGQIFNGFMYAQLDSIYPITEYANLSLFGVNNNLNLNLAGYYLHSLDRYFLYLVNLFEIQRKTSNNLHILFIIITFYTITFIIFRQTFKRLENKEIFLQVCYYTLSPYIVIFIDGGSLYTISTILAIAFFPALVKYCIEYEAHDYKLVVSLIFIIFSSIIYTGLIFVIAITWIIINFNKISIAFDNKKNAIKNSAFTILVFLPVFIFSFLYLNITNDSDIAEYNSNGMSGAIRGHIFFPLMQIHSWAYYNYWEPRVVANFYETFNTSIYKILSISISITIIYVLVKARSFKALCILSIGVFFAKGESGFLSNIYLFFRESQIGFLIRTPDTKFGLIILSVYTYTLSIAENKIKYILGTLIIVFTIYNINHIHLQGGITPSLANPSLSAFYKYENYDKIIDIINDKTYDNYVVITNSNLCEAKFINQQYLACTDIVLKNSNKQVINTNNTNISELYNNIENNIKFPTLLLINKNLVLKREPSIDLLKKYGFNEIYSDSYYDLYEKKIKNNCNNKYKFGCYDTNGLEVVSANQRYLEFNGFDIKSKYNEHFIIEKNNKYNENIFILYLFNASLIISYLICLITVLKRSSP